MPRSTPPTKGIPMTDEPRRWKLPSELDPDERKATRRLGSSGRVERDEYIQWRHRTLGQERDDVRLRVRLLEEQAGALRNRAAAGKMRAREKLTVADWVARDAVQRK